MSERLRYLIVRCVSCRGFLTKAEVIDQWESWEKGKESHTGLCECGSRQIKPGNLTPAEEKHYGSKWQWFRYRVLGKRDKDTRVWDLYYRFVKGKEQDGALYKED